MAIKITLTRENYELTDQQARSIETRLLQLTNEWEARKHIYDEEIRRLKHDQASLRGVLICMLDELDKADAAKAKAAKV